MSVKISLDKDICIGCGMCFNMCPIGIYRLEEGKAEVVAENLKECFQDLSCVRSCPVNAISLEVLSPYERVVTTGLPKNITPLKPNIYQIRSYKPGSHIYLFKGMHKNLLIDSGMEAYYPHLEYSLKQLGLRVDEVHIVVNTHEHLDHLGSNRFFAEKSILAAHRLAATKIELQDEYVLHAHRFGLESAMDFKVDLWLDAQNLIDLGNYKLVIIHPPGHTSGCICIYEPYQGMLFTGDTVFAGGILSMILESGSVGDYVDSLERLRAMNIREIYPGHGRISLEPEKDLKTAIENAKKKLNEHVKKVKGKTTIS